MPHSTSLSLPSLLLLVAALASPAQAAEDAPARDETPESFKAGEIRQVTTHAKAVVLPVFSPDGTKLMWTSSRTADGTSQLGIADWPRK